MFRVISISEESDSLGLDAYEWLTGVTNESTLDPTEIKVENTDLMVIIRTRDNFDKAVELGYKFYQAGVLTLGVFPEYIEERGCFDAQIINDGKHLLSIIRALTAPAIYSGPISFDFNDIHTTLKDAGKFYARFIYGPDVDSLVLKITDRFKQMDLSKVESGCINLYGELNPNFNDSGIDKIKTVLSMVPDESSKLFGSHELPDIFPCISNEMKQEISFGISFILAGKDIEI